MHSDTLDALLAARLAGAGRERLVQILRYAREFKEEDVNRDGKGRFAEIPSAGKARGLKGLKEKAGRLARKLWVGATRRSPKARRRLKKVAGWAAAVEHYAMIGSHAGRKLAREIARERGYSSATAERTEKIVGAVDAISQWGGAGTAAVAAAAGAGPLAGAAKVASYIPVGSLAYIAYSTADDPLSVWRAARKAVAGPDKPAKQRPRALPSLEGLSERFAREWGEEDERKHPRDEEGKFTAGAGESSTKEPTVAPRSGQGGVASTYLDDLSAWEEGAWSDPVPGEPDVGEDFEDLRDRLRGEAIEIANESADVEAAANWLDREYIDAYYAAVEGPAESLAKALGDLGEAADSLHAWTNDEEAGEDEREEALEGWQRRFAWKKEHARTLAGRYAQDLKEAVDAAASDLRHALAAAMEEDAEGRVAHLNTSDYSEDPEGAASDRDNINEEMREAGSHYRVYYDAEQESWGYSDDFYEGDDGKTIFAWEAEETEEEASPGGEWEGVEEFGRGHPGFAALRYLREAGEWGLVGALQYGWTDMGVHGQGPKHRYKGTPPDKGNRYQISPPGSRKKKVGDVAAAIKKDLASGKLSEETLADLRSLSGPKLSLLRHHLGLGKRQKKGEKVGEFRDRLEKGLKGEAKKEAAVEIPARITLPGKSGLELDRGRFDPSASYAVGGKEPWQMTSREWQEHWERTETGGLGGGAGPAAGSSRSAAAKNQEQSRIANRDNLKMRLGDIHDPDGILGSRGARHAEVVVAALAAGKPVPPEVLADYPDLKPPAPEKSPSPAPRPGRAHFQPSAGPLAGLDLRDGIPSSHPQQGEVLKFVLADQTPEVQEAVRRAAKNPDLKELFLSPAKHPGVTEAIRRAKQ